MKKILTILLAIAMIMTLSGCSKGNDSTTNNQTSTETANPTEEDPNLKTHFHVSEIEDYCIKRGVFDGTGKEDDPNWIRDTNMIYGKNGLVGWYTDYYYNGNDQEDVDVYKSLKRGNKLIFERDNSSSGKYFIEAIETGTLVDGNIVGDITGEILKDNGSKEIILKDGDGWYIIHIIYETDTKFDEEARERILPQSPLIKNEDL